MSEAKIPERWQESYKIFLALKLSVRVNWNVVIKLIEELGAAEHERNEKAETISELSRLAAEAGIEITRLKDEVERLKDEHANQLMAIAQNEALRIAQYRRDALEEAACEAEGAHPNDESSDIANWLRGLADKD